MIGFSFSIIQGFKPFLLSLLIGQACLPFRILTALNGENERQVVNYSCCRRKSKPLTDDQLKNKILFVVEKKSELADFVNGCKAAMVKLSRHIPFVTSKFDIASAIKNTHHLSLQSLSVHTKIYWTVVEAAKESLIQDVRSIFSPLTAPDDCWRSFECRLLFFNQLLAKFLYDMANMQKEILLEHLNDSMTVLEPIKDALKQSIVLCSSLAADIMDNFADTAKTVEFINQAIVLGACINYFMVQDGFGLQYFLRQADQGKDIIIKMLTTLLSLRVQLLEYFIFTHLSEEIVITSQFHKAYHLFEQLDDEVDVTFMRIDRLFFKQIGAKEHFLEQQRKWKDNAVLFKRNSEMHKKFKHLNTLLPHKLAVHWKNLFSDLLNDAACKIWCEQENMY